MATTNNPFTPVFGKDPVYFAGRKEIISDITEALEGNGSNPNLSSIFVGARGTGKTALLSHLSNEAQSKGWITANVTAIPGMLDDILQLIQNQAAHLLKQPTQKKLTGVPVPGLGNITWENLAEAQLNWRSKMNLIIEQLAQTETGILITVDEVDPDLPEMAQLATVYQHFITENKKVSLLMAGLPHNVSGLLSGKSTSFLRRAFRHDLGNISAADVEEAFRLSIEQNGKTILPDALAKAVEAINGFPFMFQLVGYRMWNASGKEKEITETTIDTGIRLAQEDLRRQIYDATFNDLSDNDVAFLLAMSEDNGATNIADLSARLGKPSGHISTYKRRLLEAGIIKEALRGTLCFSLPGFKEYLLEITK